MKQDNKYVEVPYNDLPEIKTFYDTIEKQRRQKSTQDEFDKILEKYNYKVSNRLVHKVFYTGKNVKDVIESKFISEEEIGYINFKTSSMGNITKIEHNNLLDVFASTLKKYQDCKHLIIDLRFNSGGESSLWQKGIVSHLITEPVFSGIPTLVDKENKYYKLFINNDLPDYKYSDSLFDKCKLSERNKEDKAYFNSIVMRDIAIAPFDPISFKWHLWILIGGNSASAAEEFAAFLKKEKLKSNGYEIPVTLVGRATRGVSFGFDRISIKLPNTGMFISSDLGYALNPDGSCIAEEGVKPDIESKRMDALLKCLFLIEEEEGK